ncbi:uncharacterized protein LOC127855621 isoform X1 [Dreissena polymorpha]|uniref:uncharacterized protein LOC127855621 isoform X1 n=1 Tax=Dreissena polymorpha TaxID=45954 RepID=UPI0022656127|nr:uncharacterized protein LOC127855621 isoform X1 [Dreissena polymorpha]
MLNVEMRTIIALLAILTALPCSMCSIPIYVLQEGPDEACGELIYSETGIILHSHPTAGRSVNTSEYLPDQSCNVTVQVQQGNFIFAVFTFLDLEDSNCTEDKVIFTELGKSENGSNTTVCSKSNIEFQTEKIQVQFQTNSETQGKGFELLITSFSRDANCTGYMCDVDRCIADELKNDGYKQCADGTDELQSSTSGTTVRPHVVKYLILFGAIVVSGIVLVSFILVLTLKITREGASCHCKNCSSNHSDDDIDDDISEIPTPPLPSETKLVTRKESKMATKHAQSTSIVSKEKPTSAQRKSSNPVVHKPSPRIKKIRVVPTLDSEW